MQKTRRNVITVFPSFVNRLRDNMKKMWYTFYPPFINRTYQFLRNALYTYARERGQRHLIHTSIEHMYVYTFHVYMRSHLCTRVIYSKFKLFAYFPFMCALNSHAICDATIVTLLNRIVNATRKLRGKTLFARTAQMKI